MATSPGIKGNPLYANSDEMSGPAQISAVSAWAADHIGEQADTAAALPSTGNWAGRHGYVTDVGDYVWTGTEWARVTRLPDTVTPTLGSGWGNVSVNTLQSQNGWVQLSFNATRTASASPGTVVVVIPAAFAGAVNVYVQAWGLTGASTLQVYYDFASGTVKFNQSLSSGQAIAVTLGWALA